MRRLTMWPLVLAAWLSLAPMPASGAHGYDNCTGFIDSLPVVIPIQGVWCLRADLSTGITGGVAIQVTANNVTIDCNDFKIGGLPAGTGTGTYGIHAGNRLNVTVHRCNVRGFFRGIYFTGTGGGHVVEDSRFDNNTQGGVWVEGDGSVIRRNVVYDTVGSPLVTGTAFGIFTNYAVDVIDNTVSGVTPIANGAGAGHGVGIQSTNNDSGTYAGNRVRGIARVGTGVAWGIVADQGRYSMTGNHVVGDESTGSYGLFCGSALGHASGNIVNSYETPISGCTGSDNEVLP